MLTLVKLISKNLDLLSQIMSYNVKKDKILSYSVKILR